MNTKRKAELVYADSDSDASITREFTEFLHATINLVYNNGFNNPIEYRVIQAFVEPFVELKQIDNDIIVDLLVVIFNVANRFQTDASIHQFYCVFKHALRSGYISTNMIFEAYQKYVVANSNVTLCDAALVYTLRDVLTCCELGLYIDYLEDQLYRSHFSRCIPAGIIRYYRMISEYDIETLKASVSQYRVCNHCANLEDQQWIYGLLECRTLRQSLLYNDSDVITTDLAVLYNETYELLSVIISEFISTNDMIDLILDQLIPDSKHIPAQYSLNPESIVVANP